MSAALVVSLFSFCSISLFGQAGTGTITGSVTDPAGATVPRATIEVKNNETNALYPTETTETGAYTVLRLPPGPYSVSVSAPGFKKLVRDKISVGAGQVLPLDLAIEVGSASESVTVSAEATLLKTESGDMTHNVTLSQLNNLPILGIGGPNAGSNGIRNPYNAAALLPGVRFQANFAMIVNGAPSNTAAYRIEGLDNTNHTVAFANTQSQPSADAVQEMAIQTSNYAAEFGQAGGGLFNLTMKSGTNAYHGTAYEYFVNEALYASMPFSYRPEGGKFKPRNRRNDWGGTFGGPVFIPKIYNGKDKTFFFLSYERFKEAQSLTFTNTLPSLAYQSGNFSSISPNGGAGFNVTAVSAAAIGTDALGRAVFANTIFDPTTRRIAPNGRAVADPFPGNIIPQARFHPTAVAIQGLLPALANGDRFNNFNGYNLGERTYVIPSLKFDHILTSSQKLSFFYNFSETNAQFTPTNGNADGFPDLLTGARGSKPIGGPVYRANYDWTVSPTVLAHVGVGYSEIYFFDNGPYTNSGKRFDCADIKLVGCQGKFNFPTIIAGNVTAPVQLGGMQQLGNALAHAATHTQRPSANANITKISGNHTYKAGTEMWYQGHMTAPPTGVGLNFGVLSGTSNGTLTGSGATGLPESIVANQFTTGFPYANFLLGAVTSATQYAPLNARMHKKQWGFFVQDSWKVTRKLTVDYGLRYDYATPAREHYGRSANLGLIPNPAAGGRIGAPIFEATCNCNFVNSYKWGFGPRFGFAYSLNNKTVLRGGWGLAYAVPSDITNQNTNQLINTPTGVNSFAYINDAGTLPQPIWPNFDPGQAPLRGSTVAAFLSSVDRNAARLPRQNQYSFGIQREITGNLVVEGSYVANRGVWWGTGPQGYLNQVSPAAFAKVGLNPYTNPADNNLLGSTLATQTVIDRVGNVLPYAGYGTNNTLLNALRPFPQFSGIQQQNPATGRTWYDSFQAKATQRLSHGLTTNATFTWSKALQNIRPHLFVQSNKSHQATDQPFLFNLNLLYTTPKYFENKMLAAVTRDWQFGVYAQFSSGLLFTPPAATTTNFIAAGNPAATAGSQQFRDPTKPLYLKDLNCGCINPYVDQVLNPAAWTNPVAGQFGPAIGTFYSDFRQARRQVENFNFGRVFAIRENIKLSLRAEFTNIFNRLQIGSPSTTSPQTNPSRNAQGQFTNGFGVINVAVSGPNIAPTVTQNATIGALYQLPRSGTIIARITF